MTVCCHARQQKQSAILAFFLITSISCSTSRRFYTCSALTRHVILSTHLTLLSHYICLEDTWCHRGGTWGKVRHDLWQGARFSAAAMLASVHMLVPLKKGLTELLFKALSALVIFQQSLFRSLSFSLPVTALSWHFATRVLRWLVGGCVGDRSFSCLSKNTNPPSCSHRPILSLCPLPRLQRAHPSFLAIARSWSCTCPQKPIWKQDASHF